MGNLSTFCLREKLRDEVSDRKVLVTLVAVLLAKNVEELLKQFSVNLDATLHEGINELVAVDKPVAMLIHRD